MSFDIELIVMNAIAVLLDESAQSERRLSFSVRLAKENDAEALRELMSELMSDGKNYLSDHLSYSLVQTKKYFGGGWTSVTKSSTSLC